MLPLNVESFWDVRQEKACQEAPGMGHRGVLRLRTHTMTAGGIFSLLTTM
jgi:hypothetical protein